MTLSLRARGALIGLAAVGLAVAGLPAVAAADDPAPLVGMDAPGVVKGSYIVVLKDDASDAEVRAAGDRADDAGGTVTHRYTEALNGYAAELSQGELDDVRDDPAVDHVEPAVVVRRFDTPVRKLDNQADPAWGLDRIDQRTLPLNDDYFWNASNEGAGVKAYVLDSGIRATHNDFSGRVLTGYDATDEGDGPSRLRRPRHARVRHDRRDDVRRRQARDDRPGAGVPLRRAGHGQLRAARRHRLRRQEPHERPGGREPEPRRPGEEQRRHRQGRQQDARRQDHGRRGVRQLLLERPRPGVAYADRVQLHARAHQGRDHGVGDEDVRQP